MSTFAPKTVRYIKLGRGGSWADVSLQRGELHFGHGKIPHELCTKGRWDEVKQLFATGGKTASKASDLTRELREFYTLGSDCLWITFAQGHLWWTFAEPEVRWLGKGDGHGERVRRCIGPWRNIDRKGRPIRVADLSSTLTQLQAYQQTLCKVRSEDYLIRRIEGLDNPAVAAAQAARSAVIDAAKALIAGLHWADFETLVDLIFARSGWQRVSRLGGTQADVDLLLRDQATGETAFVQVKSKARQKVLDDYVERFEASGCDRLFFVCHTTSGALSAADRRIHIWAHDELAERAVRAGLLDWLIEHGQ